MPSLHVPRKSYCFSLSFYIRIFSLEANIVIVDNGEIAKGQRQAKTNYTVRYMERYNHKKEIHNLSLCQHHHHYYYDIEKERESTV